MKLVLATKNPGKLKELKELAGADDWLELQLAPAEFDPEETGKTFEENAILKASIAARMTGLMAVGDDSGIEVNALNGAPGIYSARYCVGTDADRRHKLLGALDSTDDNERGANFTCCMALCAASGEVMHTTTARWHGEIFRGERGNNGFGYDPIFFLPEFGLTAAELRSEQKNLISHRGQAWRAIVDYLNSIK
jgi:XTP/dITP diphosphohydrolase